jgi:hypothetical protein
MLTYNKFLYVSIECSKTEYIINMKYDRQYFESTLIKKMQPKYGIK